MDVEKIIKTCEKLISIFSFNGVNYSVYLDC